MTAWLLDDGPLDLLAKEFDSAWSWPASTLHLAREVAEGAASSESRQRLLAMRDPAGAPCIQIHDGNDDAKAVLFGHLRPEDAKAKRDLGEDASIALCLVQTPEAVFVTQDKPAAYVALAELGPGRVATPYDVWSWLYERQHITEAQRDALMVATRKKDQGSQIPWRYQQQR